MTTQSYQFDTLPFINIENYKIDDITQTQFDYFLQQVNAHFKYVIQQRLDWLITALDYKIGFGHLVIRFKRIEDGLFYIFRVPIYSQEQLKTAMRARRLLQDKPYVCELIYHDEKCMIEQYIDGVEFSNKIEDNKIVRLALALKDLHTSIPTQGCGRINYAANADQSNVISHYRIALDEYWKRLQKVVDSKEFEQIVIQVERMLEQSIQYLPCVLCHNDLWRSNILFSNDQPILIDWDLLGSYPKESDLTFLWNARLTERQISVFSEVYGDLGQPEHLAWFRLVKEMGKKDGMRVNKIRTILEFYV
ncbi:aminoglycoside phosphotransferase family protein [Thiomicrospira microaerophila]|uniref:aminoglycoside phosphotransferase family protein n=1 Tax=Thiomicrospira microaerophila TaxID=406020 RepID=UPI0005C9BF9A|nr:aminoglycoside phosphotransferase family protein [Thiomicrospira microaerophila]